VAHRSTVVLFYSKNGKGGVSWAHSGYDPHCRYQT